jgi:DNA polymerase III delta prime subunit
MSCYMNLHKPHALSCVVYDTPYTEAKITNWATSNPSDPLILYGSYGCGKSLIANLLPRIMSPDSLVEVISADNKKDTAKKLEIFSSGTTFPIIFSAPFLIIDEFDNIQDDIQKSIKGMLEDFCRHGHLIITTNHLSKIDGGIVDRSTKIAIRFPKLDQWLPKFAHICHCEEVPMPEQKIALSILEGASSGREVYRRIEEYVRRYRRSIQS